MNQRIRKSGERSCSFARKAFQGLFGIQHFRESWGSLARSHHNAVLCRIIVHARYLLHSSCTCWLAPVNLVCVRLVLLFFILPIIPLQEEGGKKEDGEGDSSSAHCFTVLFYPQSLAFLQSSWAQTW